MSAKKIQTTKNYRLFHRIDGENRKIDVRKHKPLLESMKLYGFLEEFPIVCYRDKDGKLIIKDGQHRFTIAESIGLPIHWVEASVDFDPAITSVGKPWAIQDYALKHATNGLKQYQEGIDFAERHRIPLGTAFAMLAGTTTYSNIQSDFIAGEFKIKDRKWADAVAELYAPMVALSGALRKQVFLLACMSVCRVPDFDLKRMLSGAENCREKLISYGTREAYYDMLETVYNFKRQKQVGLKALATMAMRDRIPAQKTKKQEPGSEAA